MMKRSRNKKKIQSLKLGNKISKKKLLSTFSVEELLNKTQDEINIFNYKEAMKYCQEALKRDPDNLKALEISATLCLENGNLEGAKHCLGRVITLAPNNGFTKYLSMGELLDGKDSLQCYMKGIELIINDMEKFQSDQALLKTKKTDHISSDDETESEKENQRISEKQKDSLVRKLSNAYCAVADLYMSDLCDETEAETESLNNIQKAIKTDPSNPEAYQHYANFLLIKEDFEEAKKNIKKSVELWLPHFQKVDEGEACAGSFDPVEICPVNQSVRFITARILIEVEEHQLASDVLETLLLEDDEVVYTWYLLGWNLYLQAGDNNKLEAKSNFQKALKIHSKSPSQDLGVIKHMEELLIEMKDLKEDTLEIQESEEDIEELEEEIQELDVT